HTPGGGGDRCRDRGGERPLSPLPGTQRAGRATLSGVLHGVAPPRRRPCPRVVLLARAGAAVLKSPHCGSTDGIRVAGPVVAAGPGPPARGLLSLGAAASPRPGVSQ